MSKCSAIDSVPFAVTVNFTPDTPPGPRRAPLWACEPKVRNQRRKQNDETLPLVPDRRAAASGPPWRTHSRRIARSVRAVIPSSFSGTAIFPRLPGAVSFNGVGIQTFDGTGKFTATESANFGAFVTRGGLLGNLYAQLRLHRHHDREIPRWHHRKQDFVVADGGSTICHRCR